MLKPRQEIEQNGSQLEPWNTYDQLYSQSFGSRNYSNAPWVNHEGAISNKIGPN